MTYDPQGLPFAVLEAWRRGMYVLVMSGALFEELVDVLNRPRIRTRYGLTDAAVADVLALVQTTSLLAVAGAPLTVGVRDPKDERVLAAALAGSADFLVSGDDDLLSLDGHPRLGSLRIVTPRAFLSSLHALP